MMSKSPRVEIVDTLVMSGASTKERIVAKTFRIIGRSSYADADHAATQAGWIDEPSGQHSSRVTKAEKISKLTGGQDWLFTIEFMTDLKTAR